MDNEAEKILNEMSKLTSEERCKLLASSIGMTIEEQEENSRRYEAARKYDNLPIDQWPAFKIKWDISLKNRRLAFDGYEEKTYKKYYPNGLSVGCVDFKELNSKLAQHSQRTKEQIWETSGVTKLSKAILHCVEGNSMTPPFICLDKDNVSVMIGGGYHRMALCLAKNERTIPILINPSEKEEIEVILKTIKWIDDDGLKK